MNVTKKVPVLFRLFSYSLSVAVATYRCPRATFSPVQSSFGNAHSDLTTAGSPHLNPVSHYTKRHSRWPNTLQCCTLQLTCDLIGQTTRLTGMMLY